MSYFREVVAELDAMPANGDQESLHAQAETLILTYLKNVNHGGAEVARAFERARDRVGFWYA